MTRRFLPLVMLNLISAVVVLLAVVDIVATGSAGAAVAGCWLLSLCIANASALSFASSEVKK